jgi:uncharacterized protein YjbJ (UPF0337 family)
MAWNPWENKPLSQLLSTGGKTHDECSTMDKDRIEGSASRAKGKVQNAVGGAKDALRDLSKH